MIFIVLVCPIKNFVSRSIIEDSFRFAVFMRNIVMPKDFLQEINVNYVYPIFKIHIN